MAGGGTRGARAAKRSGKESKRLRELERELRRKDKALAETAALLVLQKKVRGHLGGRGRRHGARRATNDPRAHRRGGRSAARGVRRPARCSGLCSRRRAVARPGGWRGSGAQGPRNAGARCPTRRQKHVLETANRPEFRDKSPRQIVPLLADKGIYIASESTFYRVLRRGRSARPPQPLRPARRHRPKEHVARGPNEVWSWDITYLRSPGPRRLLLSVPGGRRLQPEDRRLGACATRSPQRRAASS